MKTTDYKRTTYTQEEVTTVLATLAKLDPLRCTLDVAQIKDKEGVGKLEFYITEKGKKL